MASGKKPIVLSSGKAERQQQQQTLYFSTQVTEDSYDNDVPFPETSPLAIILKGIVPGGGAGGTS